MATLESVKKMRESSSRPKMTGATHEVEFTCHASTAKKVCIAGNFNGIRAQCP